MEKKNNGLNEWEANVNKIHICNKRVSIFTFMMVYLLKHCFFAAQLHMQYFNQPDGSNTCIPHNKHWFLLVNTNVAT